MIPDAASVAFSGLALEPALDEIEGARREQLDQQVLPPRPEPPERPAEAGGIEQAAHVDRVRVGRDHPEQRLGERRHVAHRGGEVLVGVGVAARVPGDFGVLRPRILGPPEVAVVQRRERPVERQQGQPMARQAQLADDFRAQQRDGVGADGILEAREDLFGHGGPAEHVAALDDRDRQPGPGQVGGTDEAVVATADDDDVGHALG